MPPTADDNCCVLLVADRSLSLVECRRLREAAGQRTVLLLDLSPDEQVSTGEVVVRRLRIDALHDLDRFHAELLEFLDRWPRETLVDGKPFGDVFRQTTGHSVWWTGPGSQRHPFSGPIVPALKKVWLTRSAIDREQPNTILTAIDDRHTRIWLSHLCVDFYVDHTSLDGSVHSQQSSAWHRRLWFARTLLSLIALPCWIVVRAIYARIVTRPSKNDRRWQGQERSAWPCAGDDRGFSTVLPRPRNAMCESDGCVVMSGWYPNHVRDDDEGRSRVVYWQRLADVLRQRHPNVRIRYLLHTTTFRFDGWKRLLRPFVTGWSRLRQIDGLLPLSQCHPQLRAYVAGAHHQWRLMRTYARFERSGGLRPSPQFAGIDVSPLLAPHLRTAVGTMAKWSRNLAAVATSLRAASDVRVVMVHEEFYPKGMLTIAAAQSLGIPTVGVQHGQIGPQHMVYMPPPGQVRDAPSPDWFAAYGESVVPILSNVGEYPPERIRVVGAPRFDELAANPLDRNPCRDRFGWTIDQTVILVTTETFRLSSPILSGLVPLAREHPDWRIVIKLHPHDRNPQAYEALLHEANCPNIVLVRDLLPERMAACNVLVTGYSTTAMEGLLAGRPVVCADFTTAPDRYPFVIEGAAVGARNEGELRTAVMQCLTSPHPAEGRDAFLRHHLGPTVDGRAADAFVEMLDELFLNDGATKEPSRGA